MARREVMRERLGLPSLGCQSRSCNFGGKQHLEFEQSFQLPSKPPLPPASSLPRSQPRSPALETWSFEPSPPQKPAFAKPPRRPFGKSPSRGEAAGNGPSGEAAKAVAPEIGRQAERPSSASSPRVLLGRLHGVWQRRAAEAGLKKPSFPELDTESEGVQKPAEKAVFEHSSSEVKTPRQPSLLKAAAATMAASASAQARSESRASTASDSLATPRSVSETKSMKSSRPQSAAEASNTDFESFTVPVYTPTPAFTRLRVRELEPMPDTDRLIGDGHAALLGHGLLWQASFQRFAVGWMPGASLSSACLGVAELGRLLREHGVSLDYGARCKALELAAGRGAQGLDFQGFMSFVHATARSAAAASPARHVEELLSKEEWSRRRKWKRPEEVAMAVLRAVFNSYDLAHTGSLAREEYLRLLRDRGQVPKTIQDSEDLSHQLAYCREDGLPGPLKFMDFARFLACLNGDDISEF